MSMIVKWKQKKRQEVKHVLRKGIGGHEGRRQNGDNNNIDVGRVKRDVEASEASMKE